MGRRWRRFPHGFVCTFRSFVWHTYCLAVIDLPGHHLQDRANSLEPTYESSRRSHDATSGMVHASCPFMAQSISPWLSLSFAMLTLAFWWISHISISSLPPVHISAVTWRLMALVYCLVDNNAVTQSTHWLWLSDTTINAPPLRHPRLIRFFGLITS